jgi:hypothetical protein
VELTEFVIGVVGGMISLGLSIAIIVRQHRIVAEWRYWRDLQEENNRKYAHLLHPKEAHDACASDRRRVARSDRHSGF